MGVKVHVVTLIKDINQNVDFTTTFTFCGIDRFNMHLTM